MHATGKVFTVNKLRLSAKNCQKKKKNQAKQWKLWQKTDKKIMKNWLISRMYKNVQFFFFKRWKNFLNWQNTSNVNRGMKYIRDCKHHKNYMNEWMTFWLLFEAYNSIHTAHELTRHRTTKKTRLQDQSTTKTCI